MLAEHRANRAVLAILGEVVPVLIRTAHNSASLPVLALCALAAGRRIGRGGVSVRALGAPLQTRLDVELTK